jgi:MFS family permease
LGFVEKLRDSLSLRGNIPGLVISGLIEGTAWQMHELIWQPYILSLGGSMAVIGSLHSLWTLITNSLQFITGEIADSIGRKSVINGYFILSILGLSISVYAQNWRWFILIVFFYSIADSLGEPSFSPIFAESVDTKKIGLAVSLLSLTWFLPGLYSKIFAGYLGDNLGLQQVLKLVIVIEVISFLVFYFSVNETLKEKRKVRFNSVLQNMKKVFSPRGEYKLFYILAIFDRFSWSLSQGIFVAMIYEAFNFTLFQIGVIMTVMMTTTTIALLPSGKLVDRFGPIMFVQLALLMGLISFAGFIFVNSFTVIIVLQVFKGLSIAFYDPAYNTLLTKSVPEKERGSLYGTINGLKGFVSFPAPLIGAYLFEQFGFRGTFMASVVIELVAFTLSMRLNNKDFI